ncbi:MAG: RNA polymerase sigma factor [Clostridiales bacterium]|nr:MAG: RNA polymerase sigma factor [Clostridiales bacterium]
MSKKIKKFFYPCNKITFSSIIYTKGLKTVFVICLTSANNFQTDYTDKELEGYIARIAEKDSSALAALYEKTKNAVYAYSLSVLKNTHDAQDILHDCFVAVYSSASEYKPLGKPMAWIMTIAKNLCLMKLRQNKRNADIPEEDFEKYLDANDSLSGEDRLIIRECLTVLSDEERKIVVLHAVAGFKHREIAKFTGLALPTVLSKYSRAIKKLQKILTTGEMENEKQ